MLEGPIPATRRLLERTGLVNGRYRYLRDQRSVRFRGAGLADSRQAQTWPRSTRTGGHRRRPPPRRVRGHSPHSSPQRTRAHWRTLRAHLHVLRRRPRHGHHHRTPIDEPTAHQPAVKPPTAAAKPAWPRPPASNEQADSDRNLHPTRGGDPSQTTTTHGPVTTLNGRGNFQPVERGQFSTGVDNRVRARPCAGAE